MISKKKCSKCGVPVDTRGIRLHEKACAGDAAVTRTRLKFNVATKARLKQVHKSEISKPSAVRAGRNGNPSRVKFCPGCALPIANLVGGRLGLRASTLNYCPRCGFPVGVLLARKGK